MKDNVEKKTFIADKVSKSQITDKIKIEHSDKYDQIIFDSEVIRNDIFYIKYSATYINLFPKIIQFAMFPSIKNYFQSKCFNNDFQDGNVYEIDKTFIESVSHSKCTIFETEFKGGFKPNKFRSTDQWQFLRKNLTSNKDSNIQSEDPQNKNSLFDNIKNITESFTSTVDNVNNKIHNLSDKLNDTLKKFDFFDTKNVSTDYQELKNKYFNQLKYNYNGHKISQTQPTYFIPELTCSETCSSCNGEKYVDCKKCNARHEYTCPSCSGKGEIDCPSCSTGEIRCSSCQGKGWNGSDKCGRCFGRGYFICTKCKGSMYVKCSNSGNSSTLVGRAVDAGIGKEFCGGSGIIVCSECYGDNERYGKVDCSPCKATGEIGTIVYIEIEVGDKNGEFYKYTNNIVQQFNDNPNLLSNYLDKSEINTQIVYTDINGDIEEFYDTYSLDFCNKIEDIASLKKQNEYPRVVYEEIYYDIIPVSTLDYNHVLSGTSHKVSAIHKFIDFDVIFHSNPTSLNKFDINDGPNIILWYFKKAFATKGYKEKIDKKNEISLLFRIAKADGIIEESEKRVLSSIISNLNEFSNNEKIELFKLFSTKDFLPINESETVFSTKERANLVIENLYKMTKQDGQIETPELKLISLFIENINKNIGKHPGFFKSFFTSWFLSIPLILFIIIISIGVYLKIEKSKSKYPNFNYRENYDYNYNYNANEPVNDSEENQNVSQDSFVNSVDDNDQFNSNIESDNVFDNSSYLLDDGKLIYNSSFYMIATGAFISEAEAQEKAADLRSIGFINSGYLWIPDYSSLSGKMYYSTFLGPFNDKQDCLNYFNTLPEEYTNGWYVKFVSK